MDLSRLCIHTATTRPLPLPVALEEYARIGATGVTIWRDALDLLGLAESARMVKASGLTPVSLCRGGFFVSLDAAGRAKAVEDNLKILDEAAALGTPVIVYVCGATKGVPLPEARKQIVGAFEKLLPRAEELGLTLAIEPLHPMYAADRSAVNTLGQANDMVERLASKHIGVALDVYHTWWDDRLEAEIARCGRLGALSAYHVCDFKVGTVDLLNDRGLPGDGVINLPQITKWVESTGFSKHIEVEVFSTIYWQREQRGVLRLLKERFLGDF